MRKPRQMPQPPNPNKTKQPPKEPGRFNDQPKALLFSPMPDMPAEQRPVPDWAWVCRELRRPHVTLTLLWEGERAAASDGFG